MKTEINALVSFFQQHVEQQSTRPASFDSDALAAQLAARYAGHWHPQDPEQGSAYRSLTVRCLEPHHHQGLADVFAPEALFWVDPGCVAARLSAHAPVTAIYGSLPKKLQRDAAAEGSPVKEEGQLPSYLSPVKRTNRAIQIIKPSIRAGPSVSIAPPTPCTAANVDLFAPPKEQVKAPSPASEPSSADSATTFDSILSRRHAPAAAARGHRHTSSSGSSSMSTSSSSAPPSRPSSSLSVREHSNGKVGVLGGGVRLGCAAGEEDCSMVLVHSEDDSVGNVSASDSSSGDMSSASSNNTGSGASSASGARSGSGRRRRRDHRGKRGSGNGAAKQAARQARADQESERLQKQQQQQQQQQDRAPRWTTGAAFPPLHSAADPFFASRFGQQHVPSWTFPRHHPSQQPMKLAF